MEPTSGSQNIPTKRMAAQMNWTAIGICHAEWFVRSFVELLRTLAKRIPMVIAHW